MGDVIEIGPAGGTHGKKWDEKGHTNIVQIFVSHGKNGINSIQFQYVENETLVLSQTHGTVFGFNFDVVKLNHPTEYITWIRGSGHFNYDNVYSITFGTNCGEYGPFGGVNYKEREFCFKLGQDRQFHGFHGNADDDSLNSIGVYFKPNMT